MHVRRAVRRLRRLGRRLEQPFPVVGGNALAAEERGSAFFATLLDAIQGARCTADVEMYLWDEDDVGREFCDALAAAARRGVRVRVLADAYGARAALRGGLRSVAAAGGDVRAFNPFRLPLGRRLFHRTHKKLLVVDGEQAFCGGAGFSVHFSGMRLRELPWHDRMFELRGPLVAQLATVFDTDFERWRRRRAGAAARVERTPAPAGEVCGRVLRGWPDARDFVGAFLTAVERARERVLLGTPYFLPAYRLRRALRAALRRGVQVELVLPAPQGAHPVLWYASRRHYGGLLRLGARIHEFGPRFYHAKLAVVDRDQAFVGSSNMDAWSWRRNAEVDLLLTDRAGVAFVADCFHRDRERARPVTLEEHRARGVLHRTFERLAGTFDDWL